MKRNVILTIPIIVMLFAASLSAQQQGGSIVITNFADSVYTTGMAGEFNEIGFEQGQTINIKGAYGDVATAQEVNINYTIFAADWSGIVYTDVQVFANAADSTAALDGIIDFDYTIPMDADTAGQHDIINTGVDTMVAFDFIQIRVWHDTTAGLDVFWYEFVNVRPAGSVAAPKIEPIEGLKFYPNPASDEVIIETPEALEKNVMVYDVAGRRVMNTTILGNRLDVSQLHAGFHTVRVEQDGKISILKVLIQ